MIKRGLNHKTLPSQKNKKPQSFFEKVNFDQLFVIQLLFVRKFYDLHMKILFAKSNRMAL